MQHLINTDSMDYLKNYSGLPFDAIFTDPPYGILKKDKKISSKDTEWDVKIDPKLMLSTFYDCLRFDGCVIVFSNNAYTQELRSVAPSCGLDYLYPLYWNKKTPGNVLLANVSPMSVIEDISVFRKNSRRSRTDNRLLREYARKVDAWIGLSTREIADAIGTRGAEHFIKYHDISQFSLPTQETYNKLIYTFKIDKMPGFKELKELKELKEPSCTWTFNFYKGDSNLLTYPRDKHGLHPTQKPVALMSDLVKRFTNNGSVVCDPFMGSGSTGAACAEVGRDFIGIEKDAKYFEIAKNRLDNLGC